MIPAASRSREHFIDKRMPVLWRAYLEAYIGEVGELTPGAATLWGDVCHFERPRGLFDAVSAKTLSDEAGIEKFYKHLASYMPVAPNMALIDFARSILGSEFSSFSRLSRINFVYLEADYSDGFWHFVTLLGALLIGSQRSMYWEDAKKRDALTTYLVEAPVEKVMSDVGVWLSRNATEMFSYA